MVSHFGAGPVSRKWAGNPPDPSSEIQEVVWTSVGNKKGQAIVEAASGLWRA